MLFRFQIKVIVLFNKVSLEYGNQFRLLRIKFYNKVLSCSFWFKMIQWFYSAKSNLTIIITSTNCVNDRKVVFYTKVNFWPDRALSNRFKWRSFVNYDICSLSYTYSSRDIKTQILTEFKFLYWRFLPDPFLLDRLKVDLSQFQPNWPKICFLRFYPNTDSSRVAVHCSAGVGRTGTFIGLYKLIDMIESGHVTDTIDVYNEVFQLRADRCFMVG